MKFTDEQKANFKKYVRVQKSARWNMFDPRARQATGLSREDYTFCIKNYEELDKEVNHAT